jgi:hypothetical protein
MSLHLFVDLLTRGYVDSAKTFAEVYASDLSFSGDHFGNTRLKPKH